jgi:hypothetical protein
MKLRYIFLQVIFMISLLAGENETVVKQLEWFQQELQEVESKLKAVPQAKAKIKKFKKIMSIILDNQKGLTKLYLSLRKACNIQLARNEIKGINYEETKRMYRACKKEVEELLGKNGFAHRKFIRQIGQFKKILINHIQDAEDFVNDADILTKKKEYIKKAINQLKD